MREARSLDPNFRPWRCGRKRLARVSGMIPPYVGSTSRSYNPAYFRKGGACQYVPTAPRSCFQPVYGLGVSNTTEPTYQPAHRFLYQRVCQTAWRCAGAVARAVSCLGFSPVFFSRMTSGLR